MKKISFLLSLCSILFIQISYAQNISNVRVTTTDEDLIVTYDMDGKPDTVYDLNLSFAQADGKKIDPKTLKGEFGDVLPGKDKVIIWKVYEDINGLDGKIEPVFDVKEKVIKKPIANKPTVQDTPTPPAPKDDQNVNVVIDRTINRGTSNNHRVGIKASFGNSSVVATNRTADWGKEFSWELGLFYRYNLNRKLYLQPEVLYHSQKYSEDVNNTFTNIYKHDQVRGQLLAGIKPIGLGLYFNAGLYYSHQIGGKVTTEDGGNSSEMTFADFPERNGEVDPFNQTDLGYILGGTMSFNKGSFAVGVLFSKSFDNTLNNDYYSGEEVYESLNLRNRSVHFFVQKRIKGKKKWK